MCLWRKAHHPDSEAAIGRGHAGPFRLMDMATGTADFAIEALRMDLKDTRVTGGRHLPWDARGWT